MGGTHQLPVLRRQHRNLVQIGLRDIQKTPIQDEIDAMGTATNSESAGDFFLPDIDHADPRTAPGHIGQVRRAPVSVGPRREKSQQNDRSR